MVELISEGEGSLKFRNRLYSIGNSSRGKLGQPNLYSRKTPSSSNTDEEYQDEEEEEPVTRVLPRATLIDDLPLESGKIVQIETGYEHLLVLTGTSNHLDLRPSSSIFHTFTA